MPVAVKKPPALTVRRVDAALTKVNACASKRKQFIARMKLYGFEKAYNFYAKLAIRNMERRNYMTGRERAWEPIDLIHTFRMMAYGISEVPPETSNDYAWTFSHEYNADAAKMLIQRYIVRKRIK